MNFPEIVMTYFVASALVTISLGFLSTSAARQMTLVAWAILLPMLFVSCGIMASQGERAFLGTSQAVGAGSLLLMVSFGLGLAASKVFHRHRP